MMYIPHTIAEQFTEYMYYGYLSYMLTNNVGSFWEFVKP
jgi:hypothetical protein